MSDLSMKSDHPTSNTSKQSFLDAGRSALNDAIALQEHYFEQTLVSQQLWSKQLADAQAASIKAVAEEAAARAAEVSKILTGDKKLAPKEKAEDFNSKCDLPCRSALASSKGVRESLSYSRSPSWRFSRSKSKSPSPIRYTKDRKEDKDHLTRDPSSYRHHRGFSDREGCDDYKGHYSDYRSSSGRSRDFAGGRSSMHHQRNRSRSLTRRRSRSRSRSRRESPQSLTRRRSQSRSQSRRHCVDSRSPSPGYFRSELRDSKRCTRSRIPSSHSMSKSPIIDKSIANSTQQEVFKQEVDAHEHLSNYTECAAIYPLPADPSPNKHESLESEVKHKSGSREKRAKHKEKHHRRHHRVPEEDDDREEENWKESKIRRHHRKEHRVRHDKKKGRR